MATTQTTNLDLYLPDIGGEEDNWGNLLNDNTEVLDEWSATVLLKANNLSDLANAQTARTNLGLGTAAVQNDSRYNVRASNLSDVANAATARTNLGAAAAPTSTTLNTASSGNFSSTGVSVHLRRIGDLVFCQWANIPHATTSIAFSADGFIPLGWRPSQETGGPTRTESSVFTKATVSTLGRLTFVHQDWSGALKDMTGSGSGFLTWRVA